MHYNRPFSKLLTFIHKDEVVRQLASDSVSSSRNDKTIFEDLSVLKE